MFQTSMRTHTCGQLRLENAGSRVVLAGWIRKIRDFGNIVFIDLRDSYGITQLVFEGENLKLASNLEEEFVIQVEGVVRERENKNPKLSTGDIEVVVEKLNLLSRAHAPVKPYDTTSEETNLKWRFVMLRHEDKQQIFKFISDLMFETRNFLHNKGFKEIITPFLTKSTPEGARDFIVPSRLHRGKFYALPQSPQLFKQILMMSGFDRYFQIVKCFRDEDFRANRQPEFTQIDIEMSFVKRGDVMSLAEELVKYLFEKLLNIEFSQFTVLTYKEAIEDYGSDKPDLRAEDITVVHLDNVKGGCGFRIFESANHLSATFIPVKLSRKESQNLEKELEENFCKAAVVPFSDGNFSGPIGKNTSSEFQELVIKELSLPSEATVIFVANDAATTLIGDIRNWLIRKFNLAKKRFAPAWIIDFPLFEWDEEEKRFVSVHHPFTDFEEPADGKLEHATSLAYDMVINGEEVGGGSIRISSPEKQQRVFELLKISPEEAEEKFGFLLRALKSGAPPHGGIAFGLERLAMIMLGLDNIRDVIAFPKTTSGMCPLTDAPSPVSERQLVELGISLKGQH